MGTWTPVFSLFWYSVTYIGLSVPLPCVVCWIRLISVFPEFAKTENFFRSAHLENIKLDVTCYMPILDCFQMWRSIASTMSDSREKICFLSILLAKCVQKSNLGTTLQAFFIMIIIRIYRTWVIGVVWRRLCFWSRYWERKLFCICYTRCVNVKNKVIMKLVLMGSRIVVAFVGFVKTESTWFDESFHFWGKLFS